MPMAFPSGIENPPKVFHPWDKHASPGWCLIWDKDAGGIFIRDRKALPSFCDGSLSQCNVTRTRILKCGNRGKKINKN